MLRTLLESNAPRQRRRASTVASIVVHTAAIAGAIVATASARTDLPMDKPVQDPPIFVFPTPDPGRRIPRAPSGPTSPRREYAVEDLVPPGRRTITYSPDALPTVPTEVDPTTLIARDTTGLGLPRGPIGGELVGRVVADQPATAATVDRAAAMLAPPRPRYPDRLRAAGVAGRVVVRLVVDTAGRVETASVTIRESSHDLFAQAVRAVLPSLRFAPAEAGGRKVRMLVDLPFEFRLHE
jgi:protein TonB